MTVMPDKTKAKLLQIFSRDAERAVVTLRETAASGDIKLFTTAVHAMKSALANIGEAEKSQLAATLEKAVLDGDRDFIAANLQGFIATLETLVKDINPVQIPRTDNTNIVEDVAYLIEQLHSIKTACGEYNDTAIYAVLDRLKEKKWKPQTADTLEEIREALFLHSDFDSVAERIGVFLASYKNNTN